MSEVQVVPGSEEAADFTDCVVPDRKSNFDSKFKLASSNFGTGIKINSAASSCINVTPPINVSSYESSYLSTIIQNSTLQPHPELTVVCQNQVTLPDACLNCPLQLSGLGNFEPSPGLNLNGIQNSHENAQTVYLSNHARSTEELDVFSRINIPGAIQPIPRRRRNSSGSESRMRRHSAAPFRTVSIPTSTQRQRRVSHDVRDEQVDLLERLRIAATRRRSFSTPFQNSARIQITSKTLNNQSSK